MLMRTKRHASSCTVGPASNGSGSGQGLGKLSVATITEVGTEKKSWLPDMDLNHDKQIQSLLCYRYTIGQ